MTEYHVNIVGVSEIIATLKIKLVRKKCISKKDTILNKNNFMSITDFPYLAYLSRIK